MKYTKSLMLDAPVPYRYSDVHIEKAVFIFNARLF